jgi:hypothetical protein
LKAPYAQKTVAPNCSYLRVSKTRAPISIDIMYETRTYSVTSAEVDDTSDELSDTTHPDHVTHDDVGSCDATRSELEEREEVQCLTEGEKTERVGAGQLRLSVAAGRDGSDSRGRLLLEVTLGEHLLGRHYDEILKYRINVPGSCCFVESEGRINDDGGLFATGSI